MMTVQEILESNQAEIDQQVRNWLSDYLDKLESFTVQIHERGEDRGDFSGRLVDATFADFANPEMTLESCLRFTRSGISRATYCSGMGLTFDTSLDAFEEHISDVVYAQAGDRPDGDDDEWMETVDTWIMDTSQEFLNDVDLRERFQAILDSLTPAGVAKLCKGKLYSECVDKLCSVEWDTSYPVVDAELRMAGEIYDCNDYDADYTVVDIRSGKIVLPRNFDFDELLECGDCLGDEAAILWGHFRDYLTEIERLNETTLGTQHAGWQSPPYY